MGAPVFAQALPETQAYWVGTPEDTAENRQEAIGDTAQAQP